MIHILLRLRGEKICSNTSQQHFATENKLNGKITAETFNLKVPLGLKWGQHCTLRGSFNLMNHKFLVALKSGSSICRSSPKYEWNVCHNLTYDSKGIQNHAYGDLVYALETWLKLCPLMKGKRGAVISDAGFSTATFFSTATLKFYCHSTATSTASGSRIQKQFYCHWQ